MVDYTTVRVPQEAAAVARKSKRDDETWGDYLRRCADAEPVVEMTEADVRQIVRDELRQHIEVKHD